MAAPTTALDRTTTATPANPTPPTNVAASWQGTPPTPAGKVPDQALAPDEASKGIFLTPLDAATAIGRAEGSGTEVHDTTNPRAIMHSTNGSYTEVPNKTHPSSMSPLTAPALASISPTTDTAGTGTTAVTLTGTTFTPQTRVTVDGAVINSTFVSATSITASVPKRTLAGTRSIGISLADVPLNAPQTLTFT
jgi:hypothetical protein